jgi:Concanavalin A-like lectin/glucanases superfamily
MVAIGQVYYLSTGSTMEIFVNGVSDGSVSWSGNPGYATNNYVRIGCANTTGTDLYFLNGNVDDVRVWNVARTQSQISSNYQNELTGTESGLVAYYPFENL